MGTFRLVIGDRKNKTFSKLLFHSKLKCEHLLLAILIDKAYYEAIRTTEYGNKH